MAFCGYLKQSTTVTIMLGPFVDEDDGKTAEVGLAIAQADVRLSMNGGNMAQKTDANAAVHDEIGIYSCQIDDTDTGTLGLLDVMVHEAGALPVHQTYQVVTANWWDTMCGADTLHADLTQVNGANQTATLDTIKAETVLIVADTNELQVDDYPTSIAAIKAETALIVADTNELQTDNVPGLIATAQADLDIITGATGVNLLAATQASITAIEADTNELQADWHDGGRLDLLVDSILADTNELQVDDYPTALADIPTVAEFNARTLVAAAYFDPAADTVARVTLVDTTTTNTDMVAAAPTAANNADAVWDEALAGHLGVGSTGEALNAAGAAGDPWSTAIPGAYGAGSAGLLLGTTIPTNIAAIKSETALIVADTNELQTDDYPTSIAAVKADTAAILADTGTDGVLLANDAITAAKIAADAITSSELAASAATEIADAILARGVSNAEDAADTTSLAALILAAFESSIAGVNWSIRKTTGAAFATKTVTLDATADPITGVT